MSDQVIPPADNVETIFETSGYELAVRLCQVAGVSRDDIVHGNKNRKNFLMAVVAAVAINRGKSRFYGDYVKGIADDSDFMQRFNIYFDLRRKWFRYNNLMCAGADGVSISDDVLFEALMDLAVYALMGVDVVASLRELHQGEARHGLD